MLTVSAFLTGVILWTFAEYILHRFLGHVHKGRNFFKTEHLQHHARANYFAPASGKAMAAISVAAVLVASLSLVMPLISAVALMVGFTGMYGLYEIVHYRFHMKDPVAMPFIILRKHHFYHHFHDPKMNHGVTTRVWDRVFGTFVKVEKVVVPSRMPLQWLLDGTEVKPVYSPHFQLSSARRSQGSYQ